MILLFFREFLMTHARESIDDRHLLRASILMFSLFSGVLCGWYFIGSAL
jgi:hypothetical protein